MNKSPNNQHSTQNVLECKHLSLRFLTPTVRIPRVQMRSMSFDNSWQSLSLSQQHSTTFDICIIDLMRPGDLLHLQAKESRYLNQWYQIPMTAEQDLAMKLVLPLWTRARVVAQVIAAARRSLRAASASPPSSAPPTMVIISVMFLSLSFPMSGPSSPCWPASPLPSSNLTSFLFGRFLGLIFFNRLDGPTAGDLSLSWKRDQAHPKLHEVV